MITVILLVISSLLTGKTVSVYRQSLLGVGGTVEVLFVIRMMTVGLGLGSYECGSSPFRLP